MPKHIVISDETYQKLFHEKALREFATGKRQSLNKIAGEIIDNHFDSDKLPSMEEVMECGNKLGLYEEDIVFFYEKAVVWKKLVNKNGEKVSIDNLDNYMLNYIDNLDKYKGQPRTAKFKNYNHAEYSTELDNESEG